MNKVTRVEKYPMGGGCPNAGRVPSEAPIRSAKFLSHVCRALEVVCRSASADFSFAQTAEADKYGAGVWNKVVEKLDDCPPA